MTDLTCYISFLIAPTLNTCPMGKLIFYKVKENIRNRKLSSNNTDCKYDDYSEKTYACID